MYTAGKLDTVESQQLKSSREIEKGCHTFLSMLVMRIWQGTSRQYPQVDYFLHSPHLFASQSINNIDLASLKLELHIYIFASS